MNLDWDAELRRNRRRDFWLGLAVLFVVFLIAYGLARCAFPP